MSDKKVLSGIQPSGALHLGNYFGAIRQFLALQEEHECFFFIANYHALTTQRDPDDAPREHPRRGGQLPGARARSGADACCSTRPTCPSTTSWPGISRCLTPVGLLERAHSYKDKVGPGQSTRRTGCSPIRC